MCIRDREIEEVQRRRQLVRDVGDEVEGMHRELVERVHGAGGAGNGKGKGLGGAPDGNALPHPSAFDSGDEDGENNGGDDDYGAFEQQRQMEIMHEQDEALEGVFRTVGNLRGQADAMGRELEEQAELLDEVDNVADRMGGKLQTGLKRVGAVIRKNEGMFACAFESGGGWVDADEGRRYVLELLHCGVDCCSHRFAYHSVGCVRSRMDTRRTAIALSLIHI